MLYLIFLLVHDKVSWLAFPDFSVTGQGNVISRILLPFRGSVYCDTHQQVTLPPLIIMLQSKETTLRHRGLYLITKISSLAQTNVSVNPFLSHAPSRELDHTSVGLTKPCCTELIHKYCKVHMHSLCNFNYQQITHYAIVFNLCW